MAETFTSATNGPDDAPFRSRLAFDLDVDICVVGAGLAGLTVALEAARLGAVEFIEEFDLRRWQNRPGCVLHRLPDDLPGLLRPHRG